ncbi:hypothetical protein PPL_00062 [Heterostelium album PN500]|uniref:EGF-like domain-containing protein n=1 Tax=Heterostelium pallidum (strain ATCC 26659 / Pp 5 / PN500) TaxID=670386 RepID=D3BVR0_HETP5|nr:hypothetical protein PPL_00062 [Heterostelium album PN500]EFA74563.1 hypothetical protein PPL_00062 [Heterostelium album PN500]|eukprot:XP_020426697.1 hypothetical protein PPL_00062 [Heterostelium album PN500]
MNRNYFLLILFVSLFVSLVQGQYKFNDNGHYYDFIPAAANSISDCLQKISKMKTVGNALPYLGTITSIEELAFVNQYLPQYGNALISGSRMDKWDQWRYLSGPEVNQTLFTQSSGQYNYFSFWTTQYPTDSPTENFLYFSKNEMTLRNTQFVPTANYWYYLVEWSDPKEPYVPPVDTQGAQVTMSYLDNFVVDFVNITLIPNGMLPVNLTVISRDAHYKRVVFQMPPLMGTGLNFIIVDDAPAALSVYPTFQLNTLLTIVGDNFGVDKSIIKVTTGLLSNPCTYVKIIEDHKVISCVVTHYVTNLVFLYPIAIQVGTSPNVISTKIPFYDPENIKMLKFSPSISTSQNVLNSIIDAQANYLLDGNTAYSGLIDSAKQQSLIASVFGFGSFGTVFLGTIGLGNGMVRVRNGGGPYDGQICVDNNRCLPNMLYCTSNFTGGLLLNQGTMYNGIYQAVTDNSAISGSYIQFGGRPVIQPQTFLIDAGGGMVIVPLSSGSVGFKYTKRSYTINGIPQNATIAVLDSRTLGLPIPPGVLTTFNVTVTIEGYTFNNISVEYTPPTIVSVKPISTLGGPITVYGFSFGADESAIHVTLDDKECANPRLLVENTVLSCVLPPGVGANHLLVVNAGNSSSNATFSYLPPSIEDVQQQDTLLTIVGRSMGTTQFIPTVYVPYNSTPSMTLTDPQILTTTVPVYAQNGRVVVSVGGQSGSYPFTYQPFLESITPAMLPTTEGGPVLLKGRFLTQYRTDNTQTSCSIAIGGRQCLSPQFSYDTNYTYIHCVATAGTGVSSNVIVTIDGRASNTLQLGYPAPTISSYTQNRNTLTIFGANFGPDTGKVRLEINGNLFLVTSLATNPSRIFATLPTSLTNGYIKVIVDSQYSNIVPLSLVPVIDTISQASIFGGPVLINGLFFNINDSNSNPQTLSVTIGGTVCANPQIQKVNLQVVCNVVAGTGIKDFVFKLGNSTINQFYNYIPPVIASTAFNPLNETLTVIGTNIGFQLDMMSLYIAAGEPTDTAILLPYNSYGDKQVQKVQFIIPEDSYNSNIYLILDGLKSNVLYQKIQPAITSVVSNIPTSGGLITVYGNHFRNVKQGGSFVNSYIWYGGYICQLQTFDLHNLTCLMGPGTGTTNTLTYVSDDLASNYVAYTYQPPTVSAVTQSSSTVQVNGTNFGVSRLTASVLFNNLTSSPSAVSHNQTTTSIPWNSLNGNLSVLVSGQLSNNYSYKLTPVIQGVSSVDRTGGVLTIYGLFLNDIRYDGLTTNPTVLFPNEEQCASVQMLPSDPIAKQTRMTCIAPASKGTNTIDIPVVITIDGVSVTTLFTYGSPLINRVDVSVDNTITITGDQFGTNASLITVVFGGNNITTLLSIANDQITFKAPLTAMNDYLYVVSNRNGKQSTQFYVQLYPIITSVTQSLTEGGRVTIYGSYLNPLKLGNLYTSFTVTFNKTISSAILYTNPGNTTLVIVTSPPGTGLNYPVTVNIEGLKASINTFGYQPPVIQSTTQKGQQLTFIGNNFGSDIAKVTLLPSFTIASVSDHALTVNIPSSAQNGPFSVSVDSQLSPTFDAKLTPIITSIISVPITGGDITINGYYFNTRRADGTATPISVNINTTVCVFKSTISNVGVICTLPAANILNKQLNVTIDGKVASAVYSSNGPTATGMIKSTLFNVPAIITMAGTNFYDPLSVYIADVECTNVIVMDSQSLKCDFDATVQPSISLLPVSIFSSNIKTTANIFAYDDISCQNNCTNNGRCFNGQCSCNIGFGGALCHTAVNLTVPLPEVNSTSGVFTIDQDVFTAGLAFIREVTVGFVTVRTIPTDTLSFTVVSTQEVGDYILQKSIGVEVNPNPNSRFSIEIDTYTLKYGRVFEFAGERISVDTHSFKQNVKVNNWRFDSLQNTLQLIYLADAPASVNLENCNEASVSNLTLFNSLDGQQRLLSFDIENKLGIFTGRFSTRLIKDGYLSVLSVTAIELSDPIWPSKDGHLKTLVAVNIPVFESYAQFDPSFSAYRINGTNKCTPPSTPTPVPTITTATATATATSTATSTATTGDATTATTSTPTTTQTTSTPTSSNPTSTPTTTQTTTATTTETTSTTNGQVDGPTTSTITGSSIPTITTSTTGTTGPYKSCPGHPVCGGHGLCNSTTLLCQCHPGYSGADCGGTYVPPTTPIIPDPEKPSTNQTNDQTNSEIKIDIVSLRELTYGDALVKEYPLGNWTMTQTNLTTSRRLVYKTTVVGTTVLSIIIDTFNATTTVEFAGQISTMAPGAIKYSASISKYNFAALYNKLELVFSATLGDTKESKDTCSYTSYEYDENNSLRSISLQINGQTLYGRFQNSVILDGKTFATTSRVLESNDTSTSTKAKALVGMIIAPTNYERSAEIDPDFSLLLTGNAKDKSGSICNSSKKKLSTSQIVGIAIGAAAAAAVVGTIVGYTIHKKRKENQENKSISSKMSGLNK